MRHLVSRSAHLMLPVVEGFIIAHELTGEIDANDAAEAFTVYYSKDRAKAALEATQNKSQLKIHRITFSTLEII